MTKRQIDLPECCLTCRAGQCEWVDETECYRISCLAHHRTVAITPAVSFAAFLATRYGFVRESFHVPSTDKDVVAIEIVNYNGRRYIDKGLPRNDFIKRWVP